MHDWHWNLKGYLKLSVYDDETNLQEIADCIEAAIHSNWKPDVLDVEILTTDTMKNFIELEVHINDISKKQTIMNQFKESVTSGIHNWFYSNASYIESTVCPDHKQDVNECLTCLLSNPMNTKLMFDLVWFPKANTEDCFVLLINL